MALDPVPTWIHGAKHSGDILRQGTFNETGGAEGVSSPTAFRVRATQTPSNKVRVDPGGLLMLSPWDEGQTYSMRNASETLVEVPESSSLSANTWYINAWVNDPNKPGGTVPVSVPYGPYNFLTCDAAPKDNNPAYACAKIVVPKSTAIVEQDMIEDLREVSNPLTKPVKRIRELLSGEGEWADKTDVDGEWFPNVGGEQLIKIPKYANRANIEAKFSGVRYESGTNGYGEFWVEFGPYLRPSVRAYTTQRVMWDTAGAAANTYRDTWLTGGDVYIPPEIRGTTQTFVTKARKLPGSDTSASVDGYSTVFLDVLFEQVADRSTS